MVNYFLCVLKTRGVHLLEDVMKPEHNHDVVAVQTLCEDIDMDDPFSLVFTTVRKCNLVQ